MNILIDVKFYFSIQPLLLKGLNIYSFEICELFWYIKIENWVLGQLQKNTRYKTGTYLRT